MNKWELFNWIYLILVEITKILIDMIRIFYDCSFSTRSFSQCDIRTKHKLDIVEIYFIFQVNFIKQFYNQESKYLLLIIIKSVRVVCIFWSSIFAFCSTFEYIFITFHKSKNFGEFLNNANWSINEYSLLQHFRQVKIDFKLNIKMKDHLLRTILRFSLSLYI